MYIRFEKRSHLKKFYCVTLYSHFMCVWCEFAKDCFVHHVMCVKLIKSIYIIKRLEWGPRMKELGELLDVIGWFGHGYLLILRKYQF